MHSKLVKSLLVGTLVASLAMAQTGCSFVGASPKVDLGLAAVSVGGSLLALRASEQAEDRAVRECEEGQCSGAGMPEALTGIGLMVLSAGFLIGAVYGHRRDGDKAETARKRRAAQVPALAPAR